MGSFGKRTSTQGAGKDIAKFMKQVLPEPPVKRFETRERITPPLKLREVEFLPTAAAEIIPKFEIELKYRLVISANFRVPI